MSLVAHAGSEFEEQRSGWTAESFTNAKNPFERYDQTYAKPLNFNLYERAIDVPGLREINNPALQNVTAMKLEKDLFPFRIKDVADSEIHRMVLQIHDRSISSLRIFQLLTSELSLAMNMPSALNALPVSQVIEGMKVEKPGLKIDWLRCSEGRKVISGKVFRAAENVFRKAV